MSGGILSNNSGEFLKDTPRYVFMKAQNRVGKGRAHTFTERIQNSGGLVNMITMSFSMGSLKFQDDKTIYSKF